MTVLFEKLPRYPIASFESSGYWDGPLDGWIRSRGIYYQFDCLEGAFASWRVYGVYYVPKEVRIPWLLEKSRFRHWVGTHLVRFPGKARTWFSGSHHDASFKKFYDERDKRIEDLPKVRDNRRLVGITDLYSFEWACLYSEEDYTRDMQYIEDYGLEE